MSSCTWAEDEEGTWDTGCGKAFVINHGTPAENDMRFCCYCGMPLVGVPYDWEESTDEN